jgi:hypothetical protein
MSDDEIKLVTSLAGDKSWSPLWPDDPYLTQAGLMRAGPEHAPEPWSENAADAGPLYFQVEEITMFLRHFCYWNDLCPKYNELRHWLPILSQRHIKLCELTQPAWLRIIQTETIKRLTQ